MATFSTYANGKSTIVGGSNAAGYPANTVLVGEYDASKRAPLAAADVVQLIDIPAGTLVHAVVYEVVTADATQTFNIGDGTDVDGYVAAASAALGSGKGAGALIVAGGTYYAAADTIDLEVPATKALDTLKVKVSVIATIVGV